MSLSFLLSTWLQDAPKLPLRFSPIVHVCSFRSFEAQYSWYWYYYRKNAIPLEVLSLTAILFLYLPKVCNFDVYVLKYSGKKTQKGSIKVLKWGSTSKYVFRRPKIMSSLLGVPGRECGALLRLLRARLANEGDDGGARWFIQEWWNPFTKSIIGLSKLFSFTKTVTPWSKCIKAKHSDLLRPCIKPISRRKWKQPALF